MAKLLAFLLIVISASLSLAVSQPLEEACRAEVAELKAQEVLKNKESKDEANRLKFHGNLSLMTRYSEQSMFRICVRGKEKKSFEEFGLPKCGSKYQVECLAKKFRAEEISYASELNTMSLAAVSVADKDAQAAKARIVEIELSAVDAILAAIEKYSTSKNIGFMPIQITEEMKTEAKELKINLLGMYLKNEQLETQKLERETFVAAKSHVLDLVNSKMKEIRDNKKQTGLPAGFVSSRMKALEARIKKLKSNSI